MAPYQLSNNRAEIRWIEGRIAELELRDAAPPVDNEEIGGVRIEDADKRTRVFFPGKPSEEVRSFLKSRRFRWCPTAGAWQRMANEQARHLAREAAALAAAGGSVP